MVVGVAGVVNTPHESPGLGWNFAGCYALSGSRSVGLWYLGGHAHGVKSLEQSVSIGERCCRGFYLRWRSW